MEEFGLTAATWAWLLIPMPVLIVLSLITYYSEKKPSNITVEKERMNHNGY
ncbi:hypothetical protein [Niallia endozanthoxylica]|uniref:hypothetical protein n=1 Tax=Niallia endozanthoxylica TaxID=2036016 RepID=UPI00168BC411|nr:hypothetical protein [Niallia endozanthoxylica]